MAAFSRRHRLGIGLVVLACMLAGAAGAIALASSGTPGPGAPQISLVVRGEAPPGGRVVARGRVVGASAGMRVQLQGRRAGRWRGLSHGTAGRGRWALSFVMPAGGDLEVRAVLLARRRAVAVSPTARVSAGAAPVASAAPTAGAATAGPAPAASPPLDGGAAPATESPSSGRPPDEGEPPPSGEPPANEPPPPTQAYWGAWIGSQLTGKEAPWDARAIDAFEAEVGKAPSLIEFGSPFADCSSNPCSSYPFPLTPFEDIRKRGAIPFLSWSSQSVPAQVEEPEYSLAEVAAGRHDAYIREFAAAAAAWGHPFFLRFDWEMNGNWFPWGAGVNGNTPADYVAAWRHVHQLFVAAGATNATWVWCPYVDPGATLAAMASLYPGGEYVDWTCLDGYNWGEHPPRRWRSFSSLFGPSYREVTETIAPTKPLLVGEFASSEQGGSKAEWIAKAFAALPAEFPRIQGLIWFDKYEGGMDWPLETSKAATSAFAAGIADTRYRANSFGGLSQSPIPPP
ncbi:MAG: hypothetical protein JSU06_14155 [Actinobacteria bacterium]|nr:hypothetical protein [Actinomycetota bacterium]